MDQQRVGDLEISFDERFEKRWTVVQKVAWTAVFLTMLTGLSGAWGDGPLGRVSIRAATFTVKYERILHTGSPSVIEVTAKADTHHVVIGAGCLRAIRLRSSFPEPLGTFTSNGAVELELPAGDFRLELEALHAGIARCELTVDGETARFVQTILP